MEAWTLVYLMAVQAAACCSGSGWLCQRKHLCLERDAVRLGMYPDAMSEGAKPVAARPIRDSSTTEGERR